MAEPSSSPWIGSAIRDTDEYAAAFDLEVWKAQQQLRYQAQLRQAKESLEHRLHTQMRQTEQKKLVELESLRRELETMGRRLEIAEENLKKRATQLDAREAAFSTKRLKVVEQHEAYVARVEERERRTREEAQLTQSSLHARLQEKDQVIAQLQERLSTAQREYELLRQRTARHLVEQTDTDGQRLRDQERALALAHAQLTEVQRQLRDRTADNERLAEDKLHLQGQLRETARQLSLVTRKYQKLNEESQTREWERLRREQEALEAAKWPQTMHSNQGNAYATPLRAKRETTTSLPPSSFAPNNQLTAGHARGRDEFYDMLSALKREVTAGLAAVAKGGNQHRNSNNNNNNHICNSSRGSNGSDGPRSLPIKVVEKPPSTTSSQRWPQTERIASHKSDVSTAATSQPQPQQHRQPSLAEQDALESTQYPESEIPKDETSSVSAALSAVQGVQLSPVRAAAPSSSLPPFPLHTDPNSRLDEVKENNNVVVDMGDTSIDSNYYPRAELPLWANSRVVDDDGAPAVAQLPPPMRAGTLPPLAPEVRGVCTENEVDPTFRSANSNFPRAASCAPISPTPDDFVLSREAPLADATSKTQAARRDMVNFVQQLKMNREKLLETGVYTEQDSVVKEMGEKIRMYEEYLIEHL